MLSQLRRDPIIGTIALVKGGILALNAGVMASLVTTSAAGSESRSPDILVSSFLLAGLMWFSISPFLLFGKARERCNAMDLSLPIPARKLWLAHVAALILLGLAFLALIVATFWILLWLFRSAPVDLSVPRQVLAGIVLPSAAGMVLVVVLMQRVRAEHCRIPPGRVRTMYSILLLCAGYALIMFLSAMPGPAGLVPLGLAAYLGYRTYRTIPPAFAWMPAHTRADVDIPQNAGSAAVSGPVEAEEWEADAGRGPMGRLQLGWFLVRLLCFHPSRNMFAALFFFPIFFLWGLLMSGFFFAWRDMELPQFAYVILTGYLLISFLPAQMMQIPSVDFLPVSRKILAAILFIPGFLILAAAMGAGAIGASVLQRSQLQIQLQTSASSFIPPYPTKAPMLRIPAEYCEISWEGEPQDVVSPWGESHPVWKYPLFAGSRITVYSPYSTPEGSSPRYVAFQISRAIEAIYGASVPYQEILDRYLEVSADQSVRLRNPDRLIADHPEWKPQGEIALTPFLLVLISLVYGIMSFMYLRFWRAGVTEARRKAVFVALAITAIAATLAQIGLMVLRWIRPDVIAAVLKIQLLRMVQTMPGGALTLWLLYAIVLYGVYVFCRRQFYRAEVLPGQSAWTCL